MGSSNNRFRLDAGGHVWRAECDDAEIATIRKISNRAAIANTATTLGFELPTTYLDLACDIQGCYPKRFLFGVGDALEDSIDGIDFGTSFDDTDIEESIEGAGSEDITEMVLRVFLVIVGSEEGNEFGANASASPSEEDDTDSFVETFAFYRAQLSSKHQHLFPIASDYRSNIVCLDFRKGGHAEPSVVYYDRSFEPDMAVFPIAPSFEVFLETLTEPPEDED